VCVQTCISTLTMRHLAAGGGEIAKLDDLRAPMTNVLDIIAESMLELQRYKQRYGELDEVTSVQGTSGSDAE
jgi:adenylate cyclase